MQSQGLKLEEIEVEHLQLQHEEQSGVQSHQLNELSNNIHFQFDDELFGTSRTNEMKSRSQKRNHQQYWTEEKLGIKKDNQGLNISLEKLRELQLEDESLSQVRALARDEPPDSKTGFFKSHILSKVLPYLKQ